MKILKSSRGDRELADSKNNKEKGLLSLSDISQNIMDMIAERQVKLLSHSSSAERVDIEVQRSRSLSLNISVTPKDDNYVLNVKSNDGKEDETLTIPNKSFYHLDVESFLKPKLGHVNEERRLKEDFSNYEKLIQENGYEIMNPQPAKDETVGNVFVVKEEGELIGYTFCYEKPNKDIYLEFCTLLPEEVIDPNKENYSSLRYRMEIQEFAASNYAKVSQDEKDMFIINFNRGIEELKEFKNNNPEMLTYDGVEAIERLDSVIKPILGVEFEITRNPITIDLNFSYTVMNVAANTKEGQIFVNGNQEDQEFKILLKGHLNELSLRIPFYRIEKTFEQIKEEAETENSVLSQILAIFDSKVLEPDEIMALIQDRIAPWNCELRQENPSPADINKRYKVKLDYEFETLHEQGKECPLLETKVDMVIYNFDRYHYLHIHLDNNFIEGEYMVNLTKDIPLAIQKVFTHFDDESDLVEGQVSKSTENSFLELSEVANAVDEATQNIDCKINANDENFYNCEMRGKEVIRIGRFNDELESKGTPYYDIKFIKPVQAHLPKDPKTLSFDFPEIIFHPVNGYQQLDALKRQVQEFEKYITLDG